MSDEMNICVVCLRTATVLKPFNSKIADFHEELCASYYNFALSDPRFCLECQHHLEKFHKFKEKCVLAMKVLNTWKTKAGVKEPLKQLHTLLPQSGLGAWSPNNTKMFIFRDESEPESSDTTLNRGPVQNLVQSAPEINVPWIISNLKIEPERMVKVNIVQSIPKSETNTEPISIGDLKLPKDIKLEITCEGHSEVQNLDNVIETKEVTVEFGPEHKSDREKDVVLIENEHNLQSNEHLHELECIDDTILVSEDDIESNNTLNITASDYDKDIETDSSINSDDIREIDEALENSAVESDDNKQTTKKKKKYTSRKKKTEAKMANICLTTDDFTIDDDENNLIICDDKEDTQGEDFYFPEYDDKDKDCVKANKIIASLEHVNLELDSINNSYEMIMRDGNIIWDIKERKVQKNRKANRAVGLMFKNINIHFDDIQEQYENIIKNGNGDLLDIRTKAIKNNLKAKFAICGEVKRKNGSMIDKEHILNCLDGKVTEYLANWLWRCIKDTKDLTSNAVKVLGLIQDKYQDSKYESVFEIEYTNTMEAKRSEFQKRQTYEWYIGAKYKCEFCYLAFTYGNTLENHKKMHHKSAGDFVCAVCGLRNRTTRKHRGHLVLHEAVYKCKLCPMVTYYRDTMRNHCDQHSGVKHRCEPCNKTFSSHSAYNTHRSYEHRRPHVCTRCGRTFETEDNLNTHKKSQHRREPPTDDSASVMCKECQLSFPSQQVYERHIRFTHGDLNRWVTKNQPNQPVQRTTQPKIKKAFIGKRKRNTLKKPVYTCPVCKLAGPSYGWLCSHGRWEHKKDLSEMYAKKHQYLCDVCGKGFGNKYSLRDHLNIHAGERAFACEKCPKRFHSAKRLLYHQQYHGPRGFVCELCGKKFHTQANLYSHTQAHIGIRRHECDSCGKRFVSATTLKEHIRGVHLNVRRDRKRRVSDAGVAGTPPASGAKRQMMRRASSSERSSDSD